MFINAKADIMILSLSIFGIANETDIFLNFAYRGAIFILCIKFRSEDDL